ncbi:MAG: BF2992 family fimbrillin-A clan protein [Marinifilaceae bacterium]
MRLILLIAITISFLRCSIEETIERKDVCQFYIYTPTIDVVTKNSSSVLEQATFTCCIYNGEYQLNQDYYIGNDKITPCTTDKSGNLIVLEEKNIYISRGEYSALAFSPAFNINTEGRIALEMGYDFMVSPPDSISITGAGTSYVWTPPALQRKCSRLDVVIHDFTANQKSVMAISLSGMAKEAIYDIMTNTYTYGTTKGIIEYNAPPINQTIPHCILPEDSKNWILQLHLLGNGESRLLEREITMPHIEIGKIYTLTVNIKPDREFLTIDLELHAKTWDNYEWEDNCGTSGTLLWTEKWQVYEWSEVIK